MDKKPNEIYFERHLGSWDWEIEFAISDHRGLWGSSQRLWTKLSLSAFSFFQKLPGSFRMRTHVEMQKEEKKVLHSTSLKRWGITFYRSKKTFHLASDGQGLSIEGVEYFWPLISRAYPFAPAKGFVAPSTTQAIYQMPLAGALCDCKTHLGQQEGYIELATPWMRGRFRLTESSRKILASRLL